MVEIMRFKIKEKSTNYFVGEYMKQPCIMCLECGCVSFNPKDIEHKYCGFCEKFHNDIQFNEQSINNNNQQQWKQQSQQNQNCQLSLIKKLQLKLKMKLRF